jgi:hypothetical protein
MKPVIAFSVTLALAIANTILSQEPRRQDTEQVQFDQVFTLRGVDFSSSQQAQVEELRRRADFHD